MDGIDLYHCNHLHIQLSSDSVQFEYLTTVLLSKQTTWLLSIYNYSERKASPNDAS